MFDEYDNESVEHEENKIDLIIEENGVLYPIEIKKKTNAKASDASAFSVLDKDINKKRGTVAIICLGEEKLKLRKTYVPCLLIIQ